MLELQNSKTSCLLKYVIERVGGEVALPHLVKLLYLIDLEWVRYTGRQITGLKYLLRQSGPWDESLEGLLNKMINFEVPEKTYSYGHRNKCKVYAPGNQARFDAGVTLSEAERDVADHILEFYRGMPSKTLLDEYVSGTLPVRDARNEGEPLNLSAEARVYQKELEQLAKEFSDFDLVESKPVG